MALIHEIQAGLLDDSSNVGSILLKLRYLAAKLGSNPLEEWVRHETEGYPQGVPVPEYRIAEVFYVGTFSNGFQTLNGVSVPKYFIEKYAGENWIRYKIRESLAVMDSLCSSTKNKFRFEIDCANVKLLIQDKVYDNFPCVELRASISRSAFSNIQNVIRAKMLDLTIELERNVPLSTNIMIGPVNAAVSPPDAAQVSQITNQIFYGSVTNIEQTGEGKISLSVIQGDVESIVKMVSSHGVPKNEACDLAEIINAEKPADGALSQRVLDWITEMSKRGVIEAWGLTKPALTDLVKQAVKQYWGL